VFTVQIDSSKKSTGMGSLGIILWHFTNGIAEDHFLIKTFQASFLQ
jgi:hypothetical protein